MRNTIIALSALAILVPSVPASAEWLDPLIDDTPSTKRVNVFRDGRRGFVTLYCACRRDAKAGERWFVSFEMHATNERPRRRNVAIAVPTAVKIGPDCHWRRGTMLLWPSGTQVTPKMHHVLIARQAPSIALTRDAPMMCVKLLVQAKTRAARRGDVLDITPTRMRGFITAEIWSPDR